MQSSRIRRGEVEGMEGMDDICRMHPHACSPHPQHEWLFLLQHFNLDYAKAPRNPRNLLRTATHHPQCVKHNSSDLESGQALSDIVMRTTISLDSDFHFQQIPRPQRENLLQAGSNILQSQTCKAILRKYIVKTR